MRIGAIIVLYKPDLAFVSLVLKDLLSQIDYIYLISNTDTDNNLEREQLSDFSPIVSYIWLGSNLGIAAALNIGCEKAITDNCDWVLTLDQDSRINDLPTFKLILSESIESNIGIHSAFHHVHAGSSVGHDVGITEVSSTMTSGNFLNLRAYRNVGPFDASLFIDYVDHEFCLRLRKNGFRIMVCNSIALDHRLGEYQTFNLFGKRIGCTNHNYQRRYYITRNRLFVMKKYISFDLAYMYSEVRGFIIDLILIILFESDKLRKLRSVSIGIKDFLYNRYGKKFDA